MHTAGTPDPITARAAYEPEATARPADLARPGNVAVPEERERRLHVMCTCMRPVDRFDDADHGRRAGGADRPKLPLRRQKRDVLADLAEYVVEPPAHDPLCEDREEAPVLVFAEPHVDVHRGASILDDLLVEDGLEVPRGEAVGGQLGRALARRASTRLQLCRRAVGGTATAARWGVEVLSVYS